jgi:hypothetical protein
MDPVTVGLGLVVVFLLLEKQRAASTPTNATNSTGGGGTSNSGSSNDNWANAFNQLKSMISNGMQQQSKKGSSPGGGGAPAGGSQNMFGGTPVTGNSDGTTQAPKDQEGPPEQSTGSSFLDNVFNDMLGTNFGGGKDTGMNADGSFQDKDTTGGIADSGGFELDQSALDDEMAAQWDPSPDDGSGDVTSGDTTNWGDGVDVTSDAGGDDSGGGWDDWA